MFRVYGTKLTIALIENKLKEHNLMKSTKRKSGKTWSVCESCFRVEFIKTNHSIADSAASALVYLRPASSCIPETSRLITPRYSVMPLIWRVLLSRKKGVLALLSDSTNAIRKGFTASERTVGKPSMPSLRSIRTISIIVATFASNVDRVQQIIFTAEKYGRKVVVEGRS